MGTTRTLQDRQGGIERQLSSFARDIGQSDPDDLRRLVHLSGYVQGLLASAVRSTRNNGYTDTDIASALGVSRAAVSKRWPGDGRYVGAAGRFRKTPEA